MTNKFIPRNILKQDNNLPKSLVGLIPKGQVFGYGNNIIQIAKNSFLNLINNNSLLYPATYSITGVEGFTNIYVSTTSSNSFDYIATGKMLVPDYTIAGVNLGQMNGNDIPSVANGEKVIWGNYYWVNSSGSPVTPTIIDYKTLDAPMTQVSKTANDYDVIDVVVTVDNSLNIFEILNPTYGTHYQIDAALVAPLYNDPYLNSQFNYEKLGGTDVLSVYNQYSETNSSSYINRYIDNTIQSNSGSHSNIIIEGSGNRYQNNQALGGASFKDIKLFNVGIIENNYANLSGNSNTAMGWIELWDNCEVSGNSFQGENSWLWDVRAGENSQIKNLNFTGNGSGLSDVDMMFGEIIENITINGDQIDLKSWDMTNECVVKNVNITQSNSNVRTLILSHAYIDGISFTTAPKSIQTLVMTNSKLANITDINISSFTFVGTSITNSVIDLTGFTVDINGESIVNGKGWFTITHDFSTNPLTSGSSALYNLIPSGGRILDIQAIGLISGGAGATLTVGLQTDDENLISDTVGNYSTGKSYSGFSGQATANRSLKLKAGVNTINSGTINVKVEFIL